MTRLTDTQAILLSAASQRTDGNLLPLPGSLRGGAATKVVGALLARGLIAERAMDSMTAADPALNRIWRNDADGRGVLLHITDAGLEAIGVEPERAADAANTAPKPRPRREGTKQARLIAMLEAPKGASISEITAATGWQPHTVRGAIAGALKKKLGLNVTSEKDGARARVYKIAR